MMTTYKTKPEYVQLPPSGAGYIRSNAPTDDYMSWGFPSLIRGIEMATRKTVDALASTSGQTTESLRMVVHDLNTADGQRAKGHITHSKGINVDVGYFYRDPKTGVIKNQFRNHANLGIKWVGSKRYLREAQPDWDLEANWVFVSSLLQDQNVTQILVDPIYCELLEARARKEWSHADPESLARSLRRIQFDGNHDNHFHLRIEPLV